MSEAKAGRARKLLIWFFVVVVGLPLLFIIFEYINTHIINPTLPGSF